MTRAQFAQGNGWLTFRLFVSSTFRDFGAERELLVRTVMPRLRARLERHRIELLDVDLRWGIPREAVESGEVAELCLTAVTDCHPLFLGFLGECYGMPAGTIAEPLRHQHPWLEPQESRSLTDLEMTAALRDPASAVFCVRDPAFLGAIPDPLRAQFVDDDPVRRARLDRLRERVRASSATILEAYPCVWDPDAIDPFRRSPGAVGGLDRLGDALESILFDRLLAITGRRDLDDSISRRERIDASHTRYRELLTREFGGREHELAVLRGLVDEPVGTPIVLLGEPGIGKSSLAAKLAQECETTDPTIAVFTHFFGAGVHALGLRALCERLLRHLAADGPPPLRQQSLAELTEARLEDLLRTALSGVPDGRRHLIVIDGIEDIAVGNPMYRLGWLPPELPPNVAVVLTIDTPEPTTHIVHTRDGHPVTLHVDFREAMVRRLHFHRGQLPRGARVFDVGSMTAADLRTQIGATLSLTARSLSSADLSRCIAANRTGNPLAMRGLIEALRFCSSIDHLEATLNVIANREAESSPALAVAAPFWVLLEQLVEDVGDQSPRDVVQYLTATSTGLTREELVALLTSDTREDAVSLTLTRLRPFLFADEGRYRLRYRAPVTSCIFRSRHPGTHLSIDAATARLTRYFESLPLSDRKALEYFQLLGSTLEGIEELPERMLTDVDLLARARELDPAALEACFLATMGFEQGVDGTRVVKVLDATTRRLSNLEDAAHVGFEQGDLRSAELATLRQWNLASIHTAFEAQATTALLNLARISAFRRRWPNVFRYVRRLQEAGRDTGVEVLVHENLAVLAFLAADSEEQALEARLLRLWRAHRGTDLERKTLESLRTRSPQVLSYLEPLLRDPISELPPPPAEAIATFFDDYLRPIRTEAGIQSRVPTRILWIDRLEPRGLPRIERILAALSNEFAIDFRFDLDARAVELLALAMANDPSAYAAVVTHAPPDPAYDVPARRIREIHEIADIPVIAYSGAKPAPQWILQAVDRFVPKGQDSDVDAAKIREALKAALAEVRARVSVEPPLIHHDDRSTRVRLTIRLPDSLGLSVLAGLHFEVAQAARPVRLRRVTTEGAEPTVDPASILDLAAMSLGFGDILDVTVDGTDATAERLARRIYGALTSRYACSLQWSRFE
ncbi:MAG: AAA family ATPase [Planctomycetota bacterium]